ncbi:14_t:CDS:2 [Acaulospora colombiana]|uniref:14_t:CDS:1 n=1 Tax=Acaulospora colombiana TaxID=27376 RepID=A0ACA9KHB6_9GLOM|nr:14_t:CDS:2 [Acaulospora colombiana]
MNGLFAINKPRGRTSVDLLNALKKVLCDNSGLSKKKIKLGHGGTLDPLATGVLVVGVNDGCKKLSDYIKCNKVYSSVGLLGFATDTHDSEGKVIKTGPTSHITKEMLVDLLPKFTGDLMQIPPLYSALRMDGRRLYDYARKGIEPPREIHARKVKIHSLSLLDFTTEHDYRTPTSKAEEENPHEDAQRVRDIGKELNSEAHVVELERLQQGDFRLGVNTIEWNDCLNADNIYEVLKKYNQTLNSKNREI